MNNTLIGKTFLRLGLVSFGGPTSHIGYLRDEFVKENNLSCRILLNSRFAKIERY